MVDETEELPPAPLKGPSDTVAVFLRKDIRPVFRTMLAHAKAKGWFQPTERQEEQAQFVLWLLTETQQDAYGQYNWPKIT